MLGVSDELKSFFLKIQERQSKLNDLSKQLEDSLQKSFKINSVIFERELKNKQKEMRKAKIDNEKRVSKIKKEYDLSENQNLQKLLIKQQEYICSFEQLYQEQQQFLKYLDQQAKNNSYNNVINSVLTDTLNLTGQRLDNSSVLDYLTGQNKSKISNFHNSIEIAISQLQNIEENLIELRASNQIDGKLQIISSSLSNFLTILQKSKTIFVDLIIEMEQIQKDVKEQEKIRKNNIILIQTIIKENQDQKENEIQEFIKQNNTLQKQLFSITEINRKYAIYQQQLQEDMQKLATLSEIQFSVSSYQIEKTYQQADLKRKPTLLASRTRVYSEKRQEISELLNQSHTSEFFNKDSLKEIKEFKEKKAQTPHDFSNLYFSPCSSEKIIQNNSFLKQITNASGSSQRNTKYIEKKQPPSTFKSLAHPEKKTAIPLKCSCPPQCLCSAQVYLQYHSCSKQLYINSHGYVICHDCSFQQPVQDFSFYCPLRRAKNKFRNYQDFQASFWQHISMLNINYEIAEFWESLQVFTQFQWNYTKDMHELLAQNKSIHFYSFCPFDSQCYHKTSQEQMHFCKSPLFILSQGDLVCKKCNYIGNPQFHFLQCPESKVFNYYQKIDHFLSCLDLYHSNYDSEDQNAEFLSELKNNLTKKWI